VKQVARQHGLHASFMPKPHAGQSGSGMHIHTSLAKKGTNQFGADRKGNPNAVLSAWIAGLCHNARAMQVIGIPTPNGYRRVRPNTFCPTHVHWGEDNRTVMARVTMHSGAANRVEFRCAGADANAYLAIAAVLAAGCDGIENRRALPPKAEGDRYDDPGEAAPLPLSLDEALAEFRTSDLARALGTAFTENFAVLCENELAVTAPHLGDDPDAVTEWEFHRYREHT
jgi:glutamine synthetase